MTRRGAKQWQEKGWKATPQGTDSATPSSPTRMAATTWGQPGHETERGLSHVHPVIRQCMATYHQVYRGNINLRNILRGVNKDSKDLPTLKGYTNNKGRSTLFLNWCLGVCTYNKRGRCHSKKGHVMMEQITPTFASQLCTLLAPGVQHVLTHESTGQGPPEKQHKGSWQIPAFGDAVQCERNLEEQHHIGDIVHNFCGQATTS